MIPKMLAGLIPILFVRLQSFSHDDKIVFATFIKTLCDYYIAGERQQFEDLIAKVNVEESWKAAVIGALWD